MILPAWATDEHAIANATWGLVVATLLLVVTAIVTVVFAWRQLSIQRRQTRIENLERQLERFDSNSFRATRRELASKRLDEHDELVGLDVNDLPTELYEVLDFFEHLGHLVRRHHIDSYDTWHTFAGWIGPTYADTRQYIAVEQLDDQTILRGFCLALSEDMQRGQKEKGCWSALG
jgi:hypothetical protein